MLVETIEHCVLCHHQRDSTATYEIWGASFTASLNQPDPSSSEIHCGNRGLISYQSTSELEVGGLPVQETASASSKCSSGQSKKSRSYQGCFFMG